MKDSQNFGPVQYRKSAKLQNTETSQGFRISKAVKANLQHHKP